MARTDGLISIRLGCSTAALVARATHLRRVRRPTATTAIGAIVFILGMPFAFGYGVVASG